MAWVPFFRSDRKRSLERSGPASKKKRQGSNEVRRRSWWRPPAGVVIVFLLVYATAAFVMLYRTPVSNSALVHGERAPRSIAAVVDFSYPNSQRTREKRDRAAQKVRAVEFAGTAP